jgi:F-type H+-transporting ATPase subunit b
VLLDWFTIVAQIVNFLLLVVLLKYFLYDRIIHAMDEREARIAARMQEAEARQAEAEREADNYRQQRQELEGQRAELLARAKVEADTRRDALLEKARAEVDTMQAGWRQVLRQEQAAFLQELRQRAGQHVYATARRALRDLAGADVEAQMIAAFLERLQGLDGQDWHAIAKALQASAQPLAVVSAFDLPPQARQQLLEILRHYLGPLEVRFATAPEVICGIEMKVDGYKLAWNLDYYLATLEDSVARAFEEELHEQETESSRLPDARAAAATRTFRPRAQEHGRREHDEMGSRKSEDGIG